MDEESSANANRSVFTTSVFTTSVFTTSVFTTSVFTTSVFTQAKVMRMRAGVSKGKVVAPTRKLTMKYSSSSKGSSNSKSSSSSSSSSTVIARIYDEIQQ
jgi:hypothetical protein